MGYEVHGESDLIWCDRTHLGSFEPERQDIVRNWLDRSVAVLLNKDTTGNGYGLFGIIFRGLKAGDADARLIARFEEARAISFEGTEVTDSGVEAISNMPRLESLDLVDTEVSDHSLGHVLRLPALEFLHVEGTEVTRRGVASLQRARRKLEVCSDFD